MYTGCTPELVALNTRNAGIEMRLFPACAFRERINPFAGGKGDSCRKRGSGPDRIADCVRTARSRGHPRARSRPASTGPRGPSTTGREPGAKRKPAPKATKTAPPRVPEPARPHKTARTLILISRVPMNRQGVATAPPSLAEQAAPNAVRARGAQKAFRRRRKSHRGNRRMFVPPAGATQGARRGVRWSLFRPNWAGVCLWTEDVARGSLTVRRVLTSGSCSGVGGWGRSA